MEECTSTPEASGYVWKNALALQISGYVWKNAIVLQRLVDMYGRKQ